jgi:hypothetical protein
MRPALRNIWRDRNQDGLRPGSGGRVGQCAGASPSDLDSNVFNPI